MRRAFVLCLFVAAVGRLSAAPPERTHDIVPTDYASVNAITEIALSPDGKQVAYCLATWDKKSDKRATELWVVGTDGKGKPRQLTTDRANDRHPKWSGDGKAVYVVSNRGAKAKTQVWKVPLDGKPEAITDLKNGIVGFDYAPKADLVFFTVDETTTDDDDFSAIRKKFDKIEYGHGSRTVSVLMSIRNPGSIPKLIVNDKRYIREFAVTADGKKVAMVTAIDDTVIKSEGESRVDVWEDGKITTPPTDVYRKKAASPYAWLEGLAWNPDGTRFAFCAIFDAYPAEIIIGELKGANWSTKKLKRNEGFQVRGYGSPLQWRSSEFVTYLGDKDGSVGIVEHSVVEREWRSESYNPGAVVYAYAPYPSDNEEKSGSGVSVVGSGENFPKLYLRRNKKEPLVDPNPHTESWKFPTVEHVTWKAPDGVSVGGPLELPHGWKKGDKPLPLVVAIHGGPTTASYNDQRFDPHNGRLYFAAKGYAVLCPNYRGSTGYGDKFVTDLVGNENDIEVKDIVAGIQHLIKEGIADPERIAVMGWSNGGYLTNCLIAMKNPAVKIKAASSGAGILDTVAEWGFNDEPAYPIVFKKGLPWEQPDIYRKTSPIYGIGNVTTPTLIHVGGNDDRCPPGHSRMLYRALKEYKKVPTELCVYPGQPHGLGTLSFRTAKMEWDLAWFEKYLKK